MINSEGCVGLVNLEESDLRLLAALLNVPYEDADSCGIHSIEFSIAGRPKALSFIWYLDAPVLTGSVASILWLITTKDYYLQPEPECTYCADTLREDFGNGSID
jgi:hypothetical protein